MEQERGKESTPMEYRQFIAEMRRWDSTKLFEAQRAIADLKGQPGYIVLEELVRSVLDRYEKQLRYGGVLDQAEYARVLGSMAGMESLLEAANAVLFQAEKVEKQLNDEAPAERAEA